MPEFHAWNVYVGRIAGVQVRLHLLFVGLAIAVGVAALRGEPGEGSWWAVFFGVLLCSVLLHELGHCLAAQRRGGWPHEMMLWPLGGLVQASVPRSPGNEIAVALRGPLVNVFLAAGCFAGLRWLGVPLERLWHDLFSPPAEPGPMTWTLGLRLAFWINCWLVLVNLLPALPMDGGRILRGLLWKAVGYRRAVRYSQILSQVCGGTLCLAPVALRWSGYSAAVFLEIPLIALGVFLLLTSRPVTRRKAADDDLSAEEFPLLDGEESLVSEVAEADVGGVPLLGQVLDGRMEEKLHAAQRRREEEEDRRVDEILLRLHETGLAGLPPEDRELLQRASARYRQRQQ